MCTQVELNLQPIDFESYVEPLYHSSSYFIGYILSQLSNTSTCTNGAPSRCQQFGLRGHSVSLAPSSPGTTLQGRTAKESKVADP